MSRLFLRLSAVVWLVTVLATVAVIGITYAVGIFPPRDLQMQAVQDFALTTATRVLTSEGEEAAAAFARQAATDAPSMRVVISREGSVAACGDGNGNDAVERLAVRDGVCWRLRLDVPEGSWLAVLAPKLMPFLVAGLASLGAAFWIVRYFMGPLGKLRDGLSGLARGDEVDRISGLNLGADDYVPKPCSPGELVARLRAILRRTTQSQGHEDAVESVRAGPLLLMPSTRTAEWCNHPLDLTGAEFNLLEVLARNAGQLVSKQDLSKRAFGRPLTPFDRRIDVHISSVRQKLGLRPDGQSWIRAVRGQGYQLVKDGSPQ